MAKKIKKEDKKKLAKLKNIAKGKVSTKMYRGSRRGKVSTQVSDSHSSHTPGAKHDVDFKKAEQIKKETGTSKDIEENGASQKWLEGFIDAYKQSQKIGMNDFKYSGKKYKVDSSLLTSAQGYLDKLTGGGGGGMFGFSADYIKFLSSQLKNWDKMDNKGKERIANNPNAQKDYTKSTGNDPKTGQPSKGGGGGGFSKDYQKWVSSKYSKQIGSGTPVDKIMSDAKVQQSYTAETGNKP